LIAIRTEWNYVIAIEMVELQPAKTNNTFSSKLHSRPDFRLDRNHSTFHEDDIRDPDTGRPRAPRHSQESYEQRAQEEEDEEAKEDNVSQVIEVRDGIVDRRDVEQGVHPLEKTTSKRSRKEKIPNIVTWDGPDDLANPKNWSTKRKWAATVIVSRFAFISPV